MNKTNDDWKKDRISSAANGTNPTVLARMKSGFAVFGDTQFLPGYCVLLPYIAVDSLNDLSLDMRSEFLTDMTIIGDAIDAVYHPLRINYEILGNEDAFLHAHIFPRYDWEDDTRRRRAVWLYSEDNWRNPEFDFRLEKFAENRNLLKQKLSDLIKNSY